MWQRFLARTCSIRSPRECHRDVARPTEQSVVLEAALAATIRNRNDVIGFPAWTCGSTLSAGSPITGRRLGSGPLAMCLHDIEPANLTDPFVALLDLLANVPGTAPNLPLVDTRVAAKSSARCLDQPAAPPTDRLAIRIPLRFAPLIGGHDTRTASAHAFGYRTVLSRPVDCGELRSANPRTANDEPRIANCDFLPLFVPVANRLNQTMLPTFRY